ncbi:MAG: MetQ/NlpA family ABC transporter substrate-binding protein [Turicibacter sp.]|nr:MetQ/NlpA family ABC transporter substrate-binding protein [Turicibacter sp.]
MKKFATLLLSGLAVASLAACGATGGSSDSEQTVRVGVVGEQLDQWEHVRDTLAEEGITLEIVRFTDWVAPNTALVEGDLDINAFQSINFLDNYNATNGQNLVPIGNTMIMYFGIYSDTLDSLDNVPVGATVALPEDVANFARGLLLLEAAGFIELAPDSGWLPTAEDIVANPLELELVSVQAQMLPRTMPDVTLTLMNASVANDAGINPHEEALLLEELDVNSPFINAIVARPEDADSELLRTVVEHFQTDEVADIIARITNNAAFAVWDN